MSEISIQLRTYFDETVERVTEEDIRIRATTERGIPVPSPRFRPRPLAAGAIGFGLAMTLLGVVLVMDRVFGGGIPDAGGNGQPGVAPTTDQGSLWLFIPVVFGLGLLATGIISARRRSGDMRPRGGLTMQTIERIESTEGVDEEILKLKKRSRWLGWLSGILAVAVMGLGAWLVSDLASGDRTSLPSEVEEVLDGYYASWNAHDAAALQEYTTSDYVLMSRGMILTRGQVAVQVDASTGLKIESIDRMVTGDGPYYVAASERATQGDSVTEDISTFTIVEVDGVWKIRYHQYAGPL